ncbi:hypothetical protein BDV96DRAFT_385872 [Lophiotrema nucula]|uniref:F-box domain-containing protein n=1 Tax=Lophiotrema nucula TaxID=690887 RepID=A0A6A5ZGS5_9PLEO|nr:hypothetical protein BDV96DRAFT_385872 [Lophiotrema nucula]
MIPSMFASSASNASLKYCLCPLVKKKPFVERRDDLTTTSPQVCVTQPSVARPPSAHPTSPFRKCFLLSDKHATALQRRGRQTMATTASLPSMNASVDYFTAIPNDIQHSIFSYLSRPDLLSIVKTHRQFMVEGQRFLFRSVKLRAQVTTSASSGWQDQRTVDAFEFRMAERCECQGDVFVKHKYWVFGARRRRGLSQDGGCRRCGRVCEHCAYEAERWVPVERPSHPEEEEHLYTELASACVFENDNCQAFLDGITENPELAKHVRILELDCEWGPDQEWYHFDRPVAKVIEHLPHLRELHLTVNKMYKCANRMPQLWDLIKNCSTPHLVVKYPRHGVIRQALQLPGLKSFAIELPMSAHDRRNLLDSTYYERYMRKWKLKSDCLPTVPIPALKRADFGRCEIDISALAKLCTYSSAISHLSITLTAWNGSAKLLLEALGPLKETLHQLQIREVSDQDVGSWMADRVDFNDFVVLDTLQISSWLWFNASTRTGAGPFPCRTDDRMGVCKLLPSSLRILEVHFGFLAPIFAREERYLTQFLAMPITFQIQGLRWVQEFVEYRERYPDLRQVLLQEVLPQHDDPTAKLGIERYAVPEPIYSEFRDAGIDLEVKIVMQMG